LLGDWTNRKQKPAYAPYKERLSHRIQVENRDTEQVHVCLALPGLSILDPRRFTLDLLNVILGEGMSSRLFAEIRDRLGLAYSISSFVDHLLDTGSLTMAAGVDARNLVVAVRAILEELSKLKETVPAQELAKAKELFKGRLLLRMEDSRSVAGWIGGQEILTGRILGIDRVISLIDAITTDELRQVAGELFVGDRLRLAVVGPVQQDGSLEGLLKL
jgi:predicted Zn-dependent peptidase